MEKVILTRKDKNLSDMIRKLDQAYRQIHSALKEVGEIQAALIEERRKHKRIFMMASVELMLPGEPTIEAYSINISRGGICLHANRFIAVETRVTVQLSFLEDGGEKVFESIEGNVRWCQPVGQIFGMGIVFVDIDPEKHPILNSLLDREDP